MVGVPSDTPVTMPEALPAVAIAGLLLLHVPPGVASVKVIEEPTHTLPGPTIANGERLTVTIAVLIQPAAEVYVIVDVPGVTPVTTPDAESTVATTILLLFHVPPAESVRAVVAAVHTVRVPLMGGAVQAGVTGSDKLIPFTVIAPLVASALPLNVLPGFKLIAALLATMVPLNMLLLLISTAPSTFQ